MSEKEICPRDCPRRSGICHNEETCERWHEHMEQVRTQRETEKKARRSIDDFHAVRKVKQRRTMKEWERRQNGR